MVLKPAEIPNWATNDVPDPITGNPNVVTPPIQKQNNGWSFKEFPPRQWFNWLGRWTAAWINWLNQQESQSIVVNGNGVGAFPTDDALIFIYAVDKVTPNNYLMAMGYKPAGGVPVWSAGSIDANTLALGTGTITGDQPITGGTAANIIVYAQTKIIP